MESYVQFSHVDLAIREIEVIYTYLTKSFHVVENQMSLDEIEKEYPFVIDSNYSITYIELSFPYRFDDTFFNIITPQRWHSIKNVIKEIKHRRGKIPVVVLLKCIGAININCNIVFCIKNKVGKQFEMAIEKIEYLVDVIPSQLNILPKNIVEVIYHFDDFSAKWVPFLAKSNEKNDIIRFDFNDGKWTIIN